MSIDTIDDIANGTDKQDAEKQDSAEIMQYDIPITGIVALEQGMLTKEQFDLAMQYCKTKKLSGSEATFEDVLVEKKFVSTDEIDALIAKSIRRMNKEFCDIVVEKEFVSRQHADNALTLQSEKYKSGELILVSDIFIKAGLIDQIKRDMVYSIQNTRIVKLLKRYDADSSKSDGMVSDEKTAIGLAVSTGGDNIPATARVAIQKKLITNEELEETLKYCESERQAGREKSFEDALVEKKYVTAEMMMKLIAKTVRKMNMILCEIAVEEGHVSQNHVDNALKIQAAKYKAGELILISDLLINAGLLTEKTRDELFKSPKMKLLNSTKKKHYTSHGDKFKESEQYQQDITLGKFAVKYSFISRAEFGIGLKYLKKAYRQGMNLRLERILLEKGFLDERKAQLLHETKKFFETREPDIQFAGIAVNEEMITREISMTMLSKQLETFEKKQHCLTLSTIMTDEKLMTVEQCNSILKQQERELILESGVSDETTQTIVEQSENVETYKSEQASAEGGNILDEVKMGSEILLNVGRDLLQATIIIPIGYSEKVTFEEIKNLRIEKGIVFGVVEDSEVEEKLLLDNSEVRQIVVAKGKPPKPGKDAELLMNFQRDYLNPGKVSGDGHIDFRDRGAVPFTTKGSVLVEIIPEVEGSNGTNVFGDIIPVEPVKYVTVTAGEGVELSKDGLKILASEDGNPTMTASGEVAVRQEIIIPGDVDYNTGNILFSGHIIVKGMVKEGFHVSGGSLTVKEIDGGIIDLKGDLEVAGGILNATIKIEGNMQATYMADSTVESYGDVIIKKEIIDSTILTIGACKSTGTKIITSNISALNGIEAAQIGTDVSEKCVLKVGVNVHAENEIKSINEILELKIEILGEKQAVLLKLESELEKCHENITETAQTLEQGGDNLKKMKEEQGQVREEVGKLESPSETKEVETKATVAEQTIIECFDSQEDLKQEALQIREECEKIISEIEKHNLDIEEIRELENEQERDPVVKAVKSIYQGTEVIGAKTSLVVKDTCKNSSIRELEGDLLLSEPAWIMKIIPN